MKNLRINETEVVGGGCWPCFSCFCSKKVVYIHDLCTSVKPIYISKNDVISDMTMRQIYEFNTMWETICSSKENKTLL